MRIDGRAPDQMRPSALRLIYFYSRRLSPDRSGTDAVICTASVDDIVPRSSETP